MSAWVTKAIVPKESCKQIWTEKSNFPRIFLGLCALQWPNSIDSGKKKKAKTHGNKNLVVLAVIRQDKVASQFVMCFNNFRTIDPILKSVCSTKSSLYYLSHFKPFPVFTPWMKWRKIYTFPLDQRIFIAELSKDHVAQRWEHLSATNVAQFRFRFHRLLFVLVFAARLFSGYSGFFLLFKNHHFQIWIRSGKCPHLYSVLNTIAA